MKEYMNYHKHDSMSNILGMPDTATKAEEYIKKAVEYGHTSYFTTNHGSMGDIFNSFSLCKKYGIRCFVGLEGYIVPNIMDKDKRNYHIVLIPRTNKARKKLNVVSSHAHIYGFYYRPRIIIEELLRMDKDDLYITTACEAGIIRDEDSYNNIFLPLYKHFGDNIMLEVQNHNTDGTKEYTRKALKLHDELGLKLIAANDSHAVDADGLERRRQLLLGKHISYGDEDTYILDYPDYDTMLERFIKQGVLTREQAIEAIDNTMIFNNCEELELDYEIKMPTIYPNLTPKERIKELKKLVSKKFKEVIVQDELTEEEIPRYKEALKYEMKIIEDTNEVCHTADYFLLNTKMHELAEGKYGGVLTRTGRGSCGSFYTNRVLGMTQLDRLKLKVPSFPERFMSVARLIENKALPDIDYNVVSDVPFVQATRELLTYDGCYPMIAYGALQESEAFRNVCRSYNMDFAEFNEVGKHLDDYREDEKWKKYIDESQNYIGIEVSASVHPCAFLLSDKNILEEYGVVRCGENVCVMITSVEADEFKVLKNDYLKVSVWELISETCKALNQPIPTVHNLMKKIDGDEKVWRLVEKGLTCTVNQMDTDNGRGQAMRYKVHSVEEASHLSAAIRPSFDAWRNDFLDRKAYTTGSKELDEVLKMTEGRILYQENLMQFFEWLGILPSESIGLIKKISKKKIKESDFKNLEEKLRKNWIKRTGSEDKFDNIWEMVQGCMSYGYCSLHGAAVGLDGCYSLYLKAYHPLEYYTVCMNKYKNDERRTLLLKDELENFGIKLESHIKFRYSKAEYSCDASTKTIYKGIESIKYLNANIANELYSVRDEKFDSFVDLLIAMKSMSINSKQLNILIELNFFSEFGDINTLLKQVELFDRIYGKKQFKREKLEELEIPFETIQKYASSITEKTIKGFDSVEVLKDVISNYKYKELTLLDQLNYMHKNLGYVDIVAPQVSKRCYYVTELDIKKSIVNVKLYEVYTGNTREIKMWTNSFNKNPFEEEQIVYIKALDKKNKRERTGDIDPVTGKNIYKDVQDSYEFWLRDYKIIDDFE